MIEWVANNPMTVGTATLGLVFIWAYWPRPHHRRPYLATAHEERHNERLFYYIQARRELEAEGVVGPTTTQIYLRAWDLQGIHKEGA